MYNYVDRNKSNVVQTRPLDFWHTSNILSQPEVYCHKVFKFSIFRIDDVIDDVIEVVESKSYIFWKAYMICDMMWKFHGNRLVNNGDRRGGFYEPPPWPSALISFGGGVERTPPYTPWERNYCGKTAGWNYMRFFFKCRQMNLVHVSFLFWPNSPPGRG